MLLSKTSIGDNVRLALGTVILLFVAFVASTSGQQTTAVDGTTPASLAPGNTAGSYDLSNFEHLNLYNGNLSASLKLLSVSGRGGAGYMVTLPIESHWRAVNSVSDPLHDGNLVYSSGADSTWWNSNGLKPGYGPGVMQRRTVATNSGNCNPELYAGIFNAAVLTRLTFTAPDGSEHELVDAQTGGAVHLFDICGSQSFSRGKVFTSNDGAAMTFIATQAITENNTNYGTDVVSGVLFFADGTRCQITDGLVQSMTDRNGNTLQFQYAFNPATFTSRIVSVTDSLNRQVSFSYADNSTVFYDQISFKGANGSSRSIRIWHASLGQALRANYSLATYNQLFPEYLSNNPNLHNPRVVSSVELPDGRKFDFRYNPYGELARVVLPTGGAVEYDHTPTSGVLCYISDCTMSELYRRVVERRVYPDPASSAYENRTTYEKPLIGMVSSGPTTVSSFNPTGTLLTQEKHYFFGNAVASSLQPVYWSYWKEGKEYKIEHFNVTNGVVGAALRRIEFTWQQAPVSWCSTAFFGCTEDGAPPNNPRLVETTETLLDTNQSTKKSAINPQTQAVGFDLYNNQTDVWEYDYDGSLKRHTHTTYLTSGYDTINPSTVNPNPDATVHIRNLPTQVSIYDAGGIERARTTFEYDNYNGQQSNHAGLVARSLISGLATSSTASYTTRGNVTATTGYLLVNGSVTGSITVYSQYDIAGNVVKSIDARGNATTFWFTDSTGAQDNGTPDDFGTPDGNARMSTRPSELATTNQYAYAFPVRVTNALAHNIFIQRDFYTAQPIDQEDTNGIVSSIYTDSDLLERPRRIIRAVNGGSDTKSQTIYDYDDGNRVVTTSSDQSSYDDRVLKTDARYDGLGRIIETRQYEGGGNYITIKTQYDALGRPYIVSNPFRLNETPKWTTRLFDSLGRLKSVTTPDNARVSTSFTGNTATVTDQAGKSRKRVTDGLGRLVEVDEDPAGLNYQTSYAYDVLDNLTTVTQGAQVRSLTYDSFKRLKSATNPESGTVTYDYDNNSNLTLKTDARGIVSTFAYDELNRNTSINYSNTTIGSPDVPDITRVYDGATNGKGRLWYSYAGGNQTVGSNVEKTSFDSYDALGRPLVLKQFFKVNDVWKVEPYQITRTYNLAGAVTSQFYPSGHSVNYNYDSAGRLADNGQNLAFTGTLGDGANRTYSRGISYASAGQMQQEQFGTTTPVYNKLFYNSRQQLAEIRASTTVGDSWDRGKIINAYSLQCSGAGCDATDNNGNLRKQEVYIPAKDQASSPTSWYQQYDYDNLNRLQRVHEYTGDVNKDWQQEYVYDRWGNRTINQNTNASFGMNIPKPNYTVDPSNNNRLVAPSGYTMTYDLAGNVLTDTYNGAGARVYDAENRMTQANDGNTRYTYNADGQRTRRKVGAVETWQIYGIDGELVAEYASGGLSGTPQKEYGYRNGELLITALPASGDQSLNLNGTGAYVQVPNSSSLNTSVAITVEAWIKVNAITAAYQDIITRESWNQAGTGGGYELSVTNSGKLRLDTYQSPTSYTPLIGSTTITTGAWHHVAGVFDGSQMRLYVDGVLDATLSTTNGPAAGTSSLKIGKASYGSYFGGLIDEARVSNSAIYASNFMPQTHLTASSSTKGLWKFDGQSTADASGNANNGTLQSSATFSADVPTGPSTSYYSGSFTGTGAYVQVPSSSSLNISGAITVEAWIKINAITAAYQDIITRESYGQAGTGGGYELSVTNTGKVRLDLYQSPTTYTPLLGSTTITTGVWHHVAGVFDGSQMRLYLDGVLDATLSTTNGPAAGTSSLKIGKASYGSYFGGLIDEARVSNSAVYASNFTPQTHLTASGSTKGLWKFDSQSTADSSGNGNDGSLQSGATYSDDVPSGDGGGGTSSSGTGSQVQWLVSDQLGTPRIIVDQTGTLASVKRHDYLPFGEELLTGTGGRTIDQGYSQPDGVRQQFTLKERDVETGLDYFLARYYSSTQGRFSSPDPLLASAKRRNPQTWNRYSYGLNNPLRYTDPDGENPVDENPELYVRRTITTTDVIVQDSDRKGNIVQQAKVTITETKTELLNADGQVDATVDPITVTTARAENTGVGTVAYNQDQLDKIANVAQNVVAVSREKLFDPTIALGIANTETRLGSAPPGEPAAHKRPDINPMQLSATSGTTATTDLRSNIAGSIDVFNRSSASTNTLNQRLQDYNRESTRVAYANKAESQINKIRQSQKTNTTLIRLSIY